MFWNPAPLVFFCSDEVMDDLGHDVEDPKDVIRGNLTCGGRDGVGDVKGVKARPVPILEKATPGLLGKDPVSDESTD